MVSPRSPRLAKNAAPPQQTIGSETIPQPGAPPAAAPIPLSPDPGPKKGRDLDGFEYLASLTPGEWDERIVYLYRQDPNIAKSDDRNKKYIIKLSMPFDEAYVQERFGGGKFLAIVKNQRATGDTAERKFSFEIEGAPKLQADEKFRNAPPAEGTAVPPADQNELIRDLTRQLVELARESRDREDPDDDAMARVAQTMQRGAEAAMEMVRHAAEQNAGLATGSPMADKVLEAALTSMRGGQSPAREMLSLFGAMKEIGVIGGAAQNPLSLLRDLKDGLGIDIAGALRGGKEDWRSTLAGAAPAIFDGVVGILDKFSAMQRQNFEIALATHRERAASRQAAAAAAAAPPPAAIALAAEARREPPASVLPAGFGAPPDTAPRDAPAGQLDFDQLRRTIVRHFQNGKAGDFVADLLMEIYPDHLPVFRAILSDAKTLIEQAKADPILGEIAGDPDFAEFVADLVRELAPEPAPRDAT